jgi:hypothetical protein
MKCFVIMPFHNRYTTVYAVMKNAVQNALAGEIIQCVRLDEVLAAGNITDDLLSEIRSADFCVADVSEPNSNVMWEVGYAAAIHKPTIAIRHTNGRLPFDIKDIRWLQYNIRRPQETLSTQLAEAVRQTLVRYQVPTFGAAMPLPERTALTIGVTGSVAVTPISAERRVRALLAPYLSTNAIWYCGAYGVVDEAAATFLLEEHQRLIVVGYNRYDLTAGMRGLLQTYNCPFVDAEQEQLPPVDGAPNKRDLLFATRANLVVLVWDSKSTGTAGFIKWLEGIGKDHVLGFV